MAITKFPNGISSQGVPVIGGSYYTTGTVFFVDSTTGSNGNSGEDKDHPFATIDYAVGQCTADKGDVIIVMPNHTETVTAAAGLDLDVAGISVIGLGNAECRPLITLTTATTADIDIDADDITLQNFRIDLTGVDAVAMGIDVNAGGFTLKDCSIQVDDTGGQAVGAMTVAGDINNVTVDNCLFYGIPTSAAGPVCEQAIIVTASGDNLVITNSRFDGWFLKACVLATGAGANWMITNNHFHNYSDTGAMAIELGATGAGNFGVLAYNTYMSGASVAHSAMIDGGHFGDLNSAENYAICRGLDLSGILAPAVAAVS